MESVSYFVAAKHKLSAFFALVFRFSSCQHPLLASALAKVAEDEGNRSAIGKDQSALRQLLNMMLSDNRHVVCYIFPELGFQFLEIFFAKLQYAILWFLYSLFF